MSTHKNIDRICILVLVLTLLLTVAFMFGEKRGIQVVADEDGESYSGSTYFTENDQDGTWTDNAYTTYITLEGSEGTIDGNGAYFYNGDLVISNAGWYVVTGTLEEGRIIVDAYDSSKVWIRLNGVTIQCSDDACLRVEQADKVFLTLAEGTENTFTSGAEYSEEALADNTGGTIFSHDDLTINGSGSLHIIAEYKHGIDANDALVITGGNITITAPQDGIHVNDSFRFMEASLTIDAGDDAVHSDGELYVESGQILINTCYEGLEATTIDIAGGEITIYPTDDGLNANGGSQTMGFGGPMGMENSTATEDEEETYIRITGGKLTIINENGRDADGLDSNGDIYIDGGEIYISVLGDGGNCAIDYNSESGYSCIVTGGTLIACGSSSMTEEFSAESTQCAVLYNLDATAEAGSLFQVTDADGTVLLSYTPKCSYSSVAFSAPELTTGTTYTVSIGTESAELTLASTAETIGSAGTMGGGMQPGSMDRGNEASVLQEGSEDSAPAEGEQPTPPEGETSGEQPTPPEGEMSGERPTRPEGENNGEQPTPPEGEMNGERPTPPEGDNSGERPTRPEGEMSGEKPTRPEGEMSGEQPTPPEGEMSGGFPTQPGAVNESEQTENVQTASSNGTSVSEIDGNVWLLLGASALVLAGGILIGWRYRKH